MDSFCRVFNIDSMQIATVCSGIGSPEFAIDELSKELNFEYENVFACEIDKYARASYNAIHYTKRMFEDMTSEQFHTESVYSDLFVGGIPCQAFSLAGKRLGELDKRGLLFYDFYRYVKEKQPKVFIIENVKGLLSSDGGKTFQNWLLLLGNSVNGHSQMFNHPDSLGYNLHHTVLNSKNFGVPQNRERVFIVGIRADLPNDFRFPIGWKLDNRLKDVLETEVDEKYYLSDKMLNYFNNRAENFNNGKINYKHGEDIASTITSSSKSLDISDNIIVDGEVTPNSQGGKVYNTNGVATTLSAGTHGYSQGYIQAKEATKQGFAVSEPGDSINLSNPNSETRRGRVGKQIANTLDTACNQAVVEPICVAMRGRNPNNPSDRTTGAPTEQRFEPNSQGITNTITSVQKDNLILEGNLKGGKWDRTHEQSGRVYGIDGVAPTVTTMGGGNQEIKTLVHNRIRRLTPLETWRLQGFTDEAFYKAKAVNSDTQLYKQAGNSITTTVIKAILKNLIHLCSDI